MSTRDLRNHTAKVLDDVEAGSTVFVTRNGRRVAALTSLVEARHPANARLLALLDATEPSESNHLDEYLADKEHERQLEGERAERLGLE